jgi:chromosome segregation ATPase
MREYEMETKKEPLVLEKENMLHTNIVRNTIGNRDAIRLLTILIVGLSQNHKSLKPKSRSDKGRAIIQSLITTSENKISNLQSDLERRKKIKESFKTRERALRRWEKELNERYFYIKNREHVIDILNKKLEFVENRLKEKEEEIAELEASMTERQEEIEVNKKILYELQRIIMEKQREIDDMGNKNVGINQEPDTRRILWVLDELLGSLPKVLVEKFAQSDDFQLYEEVLRRYNV